MGFPEIGGAVLGVPIRRTIVWWGIYHVVPLCRETTTLPTSVNGNGSLTGDSDSNSTILTRGTHVHCEGLLNHLS